MEYAKLMILRIASSFVVKEKYRSFKSEYIIPQLIMLSIRQLGLDGVSYYSNRVKAGGRFAKIAINLVLFPVFDPNSDGDYSEELAKKVMIGDARNFEMFKHIKGTDRHCTYPLRVAQLKAHNVFYDGGIADYYTQVDFYDFDCYLFKKWQKRNLMEYIY